MLRGAQRKSPEEMPGGNAQRKCLEEMPGGNARRKCPEEECLEVLLAVLEKKATQNKSVCY